MAVKNRIRESGILWAGSMGTITVSYSLPWDLWMVMA